jgi:Na+-driven multidrug efflux pump
MIINLASILLVRLAGVLFVARWLHLGLPAIWLVLASELTIRGLLVWVRFRHGGWRHATV